MGKKEKGNAIDFVREYEARRGRVEAYQLRKKKSPPDDFVPHAVATQYYLLSGKLVIDKGAWDSKVFRYRKPESQELAYEQLQTVKLFSADVSTERVRNRRQKKYTERITIRGSYSDKRGTPELQAISPRQGRVSRYEYRFSQPKIQKNT